MCAEYNKKEYDRWILFRDCSIQLLLHGLLGDRLKSLWFKEDTTSSTKHQKAWQSKISKYTVNFVHHRFRSYIFNMYNAASIVTDTAGARCSSDQNVPGIYLLGERGFRYKSNKQIATININNSRVLLMPRMNQPLYWRRSS